MRFDLQLFGIDYETCSVCGEAFPDVMTHIWCDECGSVFCEECIDEFGLKEDSKTGILINCPICNKTAVTDELLLNFLINLHYGGNRVEVESLYREKDD